ncbi:MAG: peptidase S8 [Lachnospiraceae bacterium]|nr:peptidase S8 [Lachnospiraceae bacterium]
MYTVENGKLETALNAALAATESEREKSAELSVGYDNILNEWTLIIRYNGDGERIRSLSNSFKELYGGYGIIKIKQERIRELSALSEVLYIEKPKRLFYENDIDITPTVIPTGIEDICISSLRSEDAGLYGEGILVAVIDSSVDFTHPAFLDSENRTRIIEIYDEDSETVLTEVEINNILQGENVSDGIRSKAVRFRDVSGHGTAVAGICCGNFADDKNNNIGMATKARILVIKLGTQQEKDFPRTTELMEAIDYAIKKAEQLNMPMVINLSFGNSYGSHDGTGLLETFIDAVATQGKTVIAIGSGNEGASGGHFEGDVTEGGEVEVELFIGIYESSIDVQLWKSYTDIFEIEVIGPSGASSGSINEEQQTGRFLIDGTQVMVYFGEPGPYSVYQEIFFDFTPVNEFLTEGAWTIKITGIEVENGRFDMWLPVSGGLNGYSGFANPTPDTSLTTPSATTKVISVGAYDSFTNSYADFSGRGYTRMTRQIKPDVVAPGVDILTANSGGGLIKRTGTSMAAPFVTGAAAILMEWGIIRGNDPYLYGEKVKAYLIRGAAPIPGIYQYPDPRVGWGRLCVRESLPD